MVFQFLRSEKIFRKRKIAQIASSVFLLVFVSFFSLGVYLQIAHAASLTALSDTETRVKKNTLANHVIKFTSPTGSQNSGDTITITFPSDFAVGSVDYTDIDLSHGASTGYETDETLAAAAGASAWGAAFAGRVLTLTHPTNSSNGDITAADKIVVEIGTNATTGATGDQQLTNPTTAGTYVVSIAGTNFDTGSLAVAIVDDDQVVVSTTIDPYLTFTLTTNTVSLTRSGGGNPDSTHTGFNQGSANTLEAYTNAASGYTITYYGDTLKIGATATSIDAMGTKTTSSTGVEQFGINLKDNATPNTGTDPSGAGSGTPSSDYNTADQFRFIANTVTTLASASAATTSNVYTVSYIANVAATTEAGAYSTTITYICTGNF